ncbi:MAG: molybdenum cofactor biosynthesis protein MoaE [Ruaniaceae bacterium]|nr:molybdenum cofactor biosynthesis protein MoaE [Ruaniaceae bacterium]
MSTEVVLRAGVVETDIDTAALRAAVHDSRAGAVVEFSGQVRDHDHGASVAAIEYVGHPSADAVMREVVAEFAEREGVHAIAAEHRVGHLGIGGIALFVVVAASHRFEAFSCAMDLVDRVKQTLPIWKKQYFTDGTYEWSQCP